MLTEAGAQHTQSFTYDILGRLTAGLLGGYAYGDSTHLHAATSVGTDSIPNSPNPGTSPPYTATYDAAGDMTCRSTSKTLSASCYGSNGGAQMTYDAERRLSHWQSDPTSTPTNSADYLYDGAGQRVEQVGTNANTGTTTNVYDLFGGVEEVSSSGSTSILIKYYSAAGILIGVNVGGTISYLASDGRDSASEALSTSGTVTAAQLYGPYGGARTILPLMLPMLVPLLP